MTPRSGPLELLSLRTPIHRNLLPLSYPPMRSISLKAILLATLAMFGIDIVSGMVLMGVFGELPPNATDEQVRMAAAELTRNPGYLKAGLILGTASTVLGGYLVTRLAHSVPYFNALAFGALALLLGMLLPNDLPTWASVVGFGLTVPAALLGAYLGKRGARARDERGP